jgi:HEAT repeat protein
MAADSLDRQKVERLKDRDLVKQLVEKLRDLDRQVRADSACMLARFGPAAAEAVQPLCELLLDDPDLLVRRESARTLGFIAPAGAPEAILALAAVLTAPADARLRMTCMVSLTMFDSPPPETIQRFRELLRSESSVERETAREVLDLLGAT